MLLVGCSGTDELADGKLESVETGRCERASSIDDAAEYASRTSRRVGGRSRQ